MKEMEIGVLVRLKTSTHNGLGIVLTPSGFDENPYLKEYTKVAWIPDPNHPVSWSDNLYIDNVPTNELEVVSS